MNNTTKAVALIILVLIIIPLILALPTMWLWNWLMPDLFELTEIGFWQALGINILSSLLFKDYTTHSE